MGHRTETPSCLVEQAVNAALDAAFRDAEALLLTKMGAITLAALVEDFRRRLAATGAAAPSMEHVA